MNSPFKPFVIFGLWITLMASSAMAEAPSNRRAALSQSQGRTWAAPTIDVGRLMEEDEANRHNKEIPWRVGFPMRTNLSPANSGVWVDNTDGSRTWRLDVRSKRALWMVLGFSRFELQPGAELWLIDAAGNRVHGPMTSANIKPHGQLWFPPIEGSQVTVELHWPASLSDAEPALHLGTVSHGYREWDRFGKATTATQASGGCNNDVACPAGTGWENEVRSVVRILSGGFAFCSGALINNTANDCTPYVLTGKHCTVNPPGTTYQFNYQNVNCGAGPIESTSHSITGSTRVASFEPSDFDLLRLDTELPEDFNAFFSGWSRSSAAGSRSTGIHHPSGDVKKISHNEDTLINGIEGTGYGNDHWRVTEWEDGTTEPSSSGSPLYNQNKHIVGQLHGGVASCSVLSWDEYGKTSVSWIGGGSAASRLSDWLDPIGTGASTLDGIDHSFCLAPEPELNIVGFTIDDSAGNGDGIADPGESINVFVDLENTGTGGATQITGNATTGTPLVIVTQAALNWTPIGAGGSATSAVPLTLSIGTGVTCGTAISVQLTTTATEGAGTWNFDLLVGTGQPNGFDDLFADQVETGAGNWTTQVLGIDNPWQQSTSQSLSPTTSWYVAAIPGVSDSRLMLQEFGDLPPGSQLRFSHLMDSEGGFDGGVLEYTTDGVGWNDAGPLITEGGYNLSISTDWNSPIAGRQAWSGDLGSWRQVSVDLTPLAGMNVSFRWRFATDSFLGNGVGWYVDDVTLRAANFDCTLPIVVAPGEASGAGSAGQLMIDKAPAGYFLSWAEPVDGGPVDEYTLYTQELGASKRTVPSCVGYLGNVLSAVTQLPADGRFMVVGSNLAGEGPYGFDSEGQLRHPAAEVCP